MNLLNKSLIWANVFAIAISFVTFFFPATAMADVGVPSAKDIFKSIAIQNGTFKLQRERVLDMAEPVRSAIVALPDGETGMIELIQIVNVSPNGQQEIEFGCSNLKVKNKTDLIQSCGGPAILKPGLTIYRASGKDFGPALDVTLGVDLKPDFPS
ncbi:hypothetical protein [Gloeothece verrucosa]|uniref:Uncharacterized protein n=1 Tax=Gloeothece verrucosa (strain PCC 7822) TaxID=497965 RepID=E0UC93_GLOV7|nr:hypothetical protein [Gloeothece verrucosa]ADN12850.1 conserved hypothetical protein [Gloeothece verrucosa PCC 7822]